MRFIAFIRPVSYIAIAADPCFTISKMQVTRDPLLFCSTRRLRLNNSSVWTRERSQVKNSNRKEIISKRRECGRRELTGTTKRLRLRATSTKVYSSVRSAEVTRPASFRCRLTELMNLCTALYTATTAKPDSQNIDLNEA